MAQTNHFYNTIYNLRNNGEITIFDKILAIQPADEILVAELLEMEYETEAENYPHKAPIFNANAAVWGAKSIYTVCQLILYRENKIAELPLLLPNYNGEITASAMLSADLCLRFLPQVLLETKHIDPEDVLIELVEMHMLHFHYSGIGHELSIEKLDFEPVISSACLLQLYADRAIEKKDKKRAAHPIVNEKVKASMGLYATQFWKEFTY